MRRVLLIGLSMLVSMLLVSCGQTAGNNSTEEADVSIDASASSASETESEEEIIETQASTEAESTEIETEADIAEEETEDLRAAEEIYTIEVDKPSGFYQSDVVIHVTYAAEFTDQDELKVFYTLDGEPPSEKSTPYTGPITLKQTGELQVIPLKVVVIGHLDNEYIARNLTQTYVIQPPGSTFPDIDIASVTISQDSLHNYYYGLFEDGYTADKNEDYKDFRRAANMDMRDEEWMRLAHISYFTPDGNVLMEEKIGLGISGNTSARMSVKSFKISAKELFLSEHKLNYLYDTASNVSDFSFVRHPASLKFRSGGQDMMRSGIRSSVVSRIAEESNFDGCSHTRRCLLFLNGSLYGLYDVQETTSDGSLADRFGLPDNEIEIRDFDEEECYKHDEILTAAFQKDLNIEKNRLELEKYVDMENYLLYYAVEIVCNNTDWPDNNYMTWRYTGEEIPGNPYSDGRFRFFIYDTDYSFASPMLLEPFPGAMGDTFTNIMSNTSRGIHTYFRNVMKSDYYRGLFTAYVADILKGPLSPERIKAIVQEEEAKVTRSRYLLSSKVNASYSSSVSSAFVSDMLATANNRKTQLENLFASKLNLNPSQKVLCSLAAGNGVTLEFSNQTLYSGDMHENAYYGSVPIMITAKPAPGYEFSHYVINDERIEEAVLLFDPAKYKDANGKVRIRAVAKKQAVILPVISAVSSYKDQDYIEIYNPANTELSLSGYILTDKSDLSSGTDLSAYLIKPGETLKLYGKKNPDAKKKDPKLDFSISTGEVISLVSDGTVIDQLVVPKIDEGEEYARINFSSLWKYRR